MEIHSMLIAISSKDVFHSVLKNRYTLWYRQGGNEATDKALNKGINRYALSSSVNVLNKDYLFASQSNYRARTLLCGLIV